MKRVVIQDAALFHMHSRVVYMPLVVADRRFPPHHSFVFHLTLLTVALVGSFAVGSVAKASTRGAVVCVDASYSRLQAAVGLMRPIPPNLAGRTNSALSTSEHGGHPIKAGIHFWWMASSRG